MTPDGIESRGVSRLDVATAPALCAVVSTPGAGAILVELRMRCSLSMVPSEGGHDTYLVLEDFGTLRPRLARDR